MPLNSFRSGTNEEGRRFSDVPAIQMIKAPEISKALDPWQRLPDLEMIKVNESNIKSLRRRDTDIIYVPLTKPLGSFFESFPVRTLIRTHQLDEYGFTFIDDNTCYQFKHDGDHGGIQYLGRNLQGDLILEYFGSKEEGTKLQYGLYFKNESTKFALLITLQISPYEKDYQYSCYLQSVVSSSEMEILKKWHRVSWKRPDNPFWSPPAGDFHQNRCSHRLNLKENLYVSASLRPGRESGNLVNIVDLTFGPHRSWVEGIRVRE
jgi:hypothetical protein